MKKLIRNFEKKYFYLISLLLILNIFDIYLTFKGLNMGFGEGNPIARYFFDMGNAYIPFGLKIFFCWLLAFTFAFGEDSLKNWSEKAKYSIIGSLIIVNSMYVTAVGGWVYMIYLV